MRKAVWVLLVLSFLGVSLLPSVATSSTTFPDIPTKEPFREAILELISKKVISGYPDGTFKPDKSVTRAELAVMLIKSAGISPKSLSVSPFKDVKSTHWAYGSICAAYEKGWLKGYPDGTFKPDNSVTRAELAALLIGAKNLTEKAKKITESYIFFANDEHLIPKWALGSLTLAYAPECQYLLAREGADGPILAPISEATRSEVAAALWRAFLNNPKSLDRVNVSLSSEPRILFVGFGFGELVEHYVMNLFWNYSICKWPSKGYFPGVFREIPSEENGLWKVFADGKMQVTYRIRPGLTFDDGVEITSKDFAFAYKVLNDPDIFPTPEPPVIEKVETPDKYTVVTYWRRYDLTAYQGISYLAEHLVNPIYVEAKKGPNAEERLKVFRTSKYVRSPTATSWYKVKDWKAGAYIQLEENPEWVLNRKFGIKPLAKEVIIRILPDSAAMYANFIRGVLDVASVDLEQADILIKSGKGYKIMQTTSGMTHFWQYNTTSPFLRDKRVRQALAYLTDREKVVNTLGVRFSLSSVASCWIPPFTIGFTPAFNHYKFDPVKARALLAEAGWSARDSSGILIDGKGNRASILLYFHTPSPFREAFAAFIRDSWREHGIEVRLLGETFLWSGSASKLQRGDFDIALWSFTFWDLEYPTIARNWYHKDYIPSAAIAWGGNNRSRWVHDEASKIIEDLLVEVSYAKRQTLWARLNTILADEMPQLPLIYGMRAMAFRPNFYAYAISITSASNDAWTIPYWYYRK